VATGGWGWVGDGAMWWAGWLGGWLADGWLADGWLADGWLADGWLSGERLWLVKSISI